MLSIKSIEISGFVTAWHNHVLDSLLLISAFLNLALRKPAWQKRTCVDDGVYPPELAVDGDATNDAFGNAERHCSHT